MAHGEPEKVKPYVNAMIEGKCFGTMCLSEPQAGSSLADIRTRAIKTRWSLSFVWKQNVDFRWRARYL